MLVTSAVVSTHPKYARVDGNIETVWQRPSTTPKGIMFIAHGCQHQGTDIFSDIGPDGWVFHECSSSNFGQCLGLPEEVSLQRTARSRGYVVMAVSGGYGWKSCWGGKPDIPKVASAIRHVRDAENLAPDIPVLAVGASSGGAFVGLLAASEASGGVKHLKCIVPQIMGIKSGMNRGVPTLFVHMPRDKRTAATVEANIKDLQSRGIRVGEIQVHPVPVTVTLLKKCLTSEAAEVVLRSMQLNEQLDAAGFLKVDPRGREWVKPVRKALPKQHSDTLVPDESCLAEVMNVAWAAHEFTAQYAPEILDFCEETGAYSAAMQNTQTTTAREDL